MSETPRVTLEYSSPVIQSQYISEGSLNPTFGAYIAMQGAQIFLEYAPNGMLKISLSEVKGHPGGLERAVTNCAEIIIPLSAIRDYNKAGLEIATRALTDIGYKFEPKPKKGVLKVSEIPKNVTRILEAVASV
ncbi:hypothetical protein HYU12_04110 [Candidatus Woesearchaeota archaeon]|nr:hypothetical protein [Candidatus Woesearchaeota archaeon]